MELVAYLVIGVLLLAFLRRFVYARVRDGLLPLWLGALMAGTVWATLPLLAVLMAGAELLPIVWVLAAGSFVVAAVSLVVFAKLTARRSTKDADRAH